MSTAWIRRTYLASKALSSRYLHPVLPSVHEAIFVRLKGGLRRRYLRALSAGQGRGLDGSSRLYGIHSSSEGRTFRPLVSVIVPNFRHERFLRRRLDSIYGQTYDNFEVILLDDASGDGSVPILQEYAERHPRITRCCFNELNSGGVFSQWRRGLTMAKGDLIWMAESDDYCSENFLAELVAPFENQAVMLSYCRSVFVKGEAEEQIWSIEEFLAELDPVLWKAPFTLSAHRLVNFAWAMKNIVPNVSSAIFRHPGDLELLRDESWARMRICGDWVFYLHLIRGGLVSYTAAATNFYRIHPDNTSVNTYSRDIYYQEHERVALELVSLYRLQDGVLERKRAILERHWEVHRPDLPLVELPRLYDLDRIVAAAAQRKPNLMMVGFALIAGGGETFPIKLANLMKAAGFAVTFFNCRHEKTEPGVRAMLRRDIPLLELDELHKLEVVVDDMGVEILHSHHAWVDATLCALFEDKREPRLVVSAHGMYEMMPAANLADTLPLLENRVDTLVYTTDKNLQAFDVQKFGVEHVVKIGNALDVFPVTPIARAELGIGEDDFVLCLVSRAIPEKAWAEAIEAVRIAASAASRPIHLVLIGEGDEYTRLKAVVTESYIHFLGFRANIRDYFAMADIGFLPSRFKGESFPLVLIDCLHAGRPMLASRIGEIPAMLATDEGDAGFVFDLEDWQVPIDALAELIRRYTDDRAFYQAQLDRVAIAAHKFDPDALQAQYANVYMRARSRDGRQRAEMVV